MINLGNPFRMQTSEQIESDTVFLKLFGLGALDVLPDEEIWNRVQVIWSSPGGGKTSLLRLFTPNALLTLYAHRRADDDFKELFQKMKILGAIGDEGPRVLGAMLSCSKGRYDTIEDLDLEATFKRKLLISLLDSRIILTALRGITALKGLEYPTELNQVSFNAPYDVILPKGLSRQFDGKQLYEWACNTEESTAGVLDSFEPITLEELAGYDCLISPHLLKPANVVFDNEAIASHTLIMLDDCHKLTSNQRKSLLSIIDQRPAVGVWIAERLEALSSEELLSPGALSERDINIINLEEIWRNKKKKFENVTLNTSDKRARFSNKIEIQFFSACLQDVFEEQYWQPIIEKIIDTLSDRIIKRTEGTKRYMEWISNRKAFEGTPLEKAVAWRVLEILIERDEQSKQRSLSDFSEKLDVQYDISELEKREHSNVKAAAELFLSDEFKLPYYFSTPRLVSTASSNIEQFLMISAGLFEEIISARLRDPIATLSPKRQENIIKKVINERWKEIPTRVKNGREIMKFLVTIGEFGRWETMKQNAPYAPGVTGIAISMDEREELIHNQEAYGNLCGILSNCIAHNLLEYREDRQCKGEDWVIFYLNRMLCVHFGLPLQYGGWREKTLKELLKWKENRLIPRKRGGKSHGK